VLYARGGSATVVIHRHAKVSGVTAEQRRYASNAKMQQRACNRSA
jgi:hypothetical protein